MVDGVPKEQDGITNFIQAARNADGTQEQEQAADELWLKCLGRVKNYTRKLCRRVGLQHLPDTDHDVAMSVLGSVIHGLQQGRWPGLQDSEALWKMLYTVTRRKCYRAIDKDLKEKAISTDEEDNQWMAPADFADHSETMLNELLGLLGPADDDWLTADHVTQDERGPLLEAVSDRARERLECGTPPPQPNSTLTAEQRRIQQLRQIALLKILGYTNDQMKAITGIPKRTIDLRLRIVREKWKNAIDDGQ